MRQYSNGIDMSEDSLQEKEESLEIVPVEEEKLAEEVNIIETLTSEIEIKERKPRGDKTSLLITLGIIFGPISLIISLFSEVFDFLTINATYLFIATSLIFFSSSIISAKSIR